MPIDAARDLQLRTVDVESLVARRYCQIASAPDRLGGIRVRLSDHTAHDEPLDDDGRGSKFVWIN